MSTCFQKVLLYIIQYELSLWLNFYYFKRGNS